MTYQPRRGFFAVGLITSNQITSPTGVGTISLDVFYTSSGEYGGTPQSSGLAITETQADGNTGFTPYFSQCPSSNGGFGADIPERQGSRAIGGSIGCGVYSNATPVIHYRSYDSDRVLSQSYIALYGEIT